MIQKGWRPAGGVCAWSGGMMIMQAMVHEPPKDADAKNDPKKLGLPTSGNPIL